MPACPLLITSFLILFTLEHRLILTYAWHMCLGLLLRYRAWPVLLKTMLLEVNLQQVLFLPMCREASGDEPALPLLLISMANWDLWLATLPCWQEELSQRLLWVTHCRGMGCDVGVWGADSTVAPAVCPAPGLRTAGRELPASCWGITDCKVPLSKPWQLGSCRASSLGGCAGAGTDSRHQQPGSCSCPWVTALADLLRVLKLTSQHREGLGFSVCFASLPSYYNTFLSFPLLQIIYEQ